MRAISPFDQSRIDATSSSAFRRSSVISSAASAWTRSLAAFASAAKRSMVSSRAASAVACIALVRSARNLLGLRAPAARAGTASAAGADSAPGADSTAASAVADGLSVWAGSKSAVPVVSTWSAVAGSTSIMAAASVSSATGSPLSVVASAGALSGSASPRSDVQGSRNPGLVSVVAMDQKSSLVRVVDVAAGLGGRPTWAGHPGRGGIVPAVVSKVQLARGTSGVRRWYRRRVGAHHCCVGAPLLEPGVRCADGPAGHLRRAPGRDRHARSRDARPAHLRHRPLQLPLHVLHAQGGLRPGLRIPAA